MSEKTVLERAYGKELDGVSFSGLQTGVYPIYGVRPKSPC